MMLQIIFDRPLRETTKIPVIPERNDIPSRLSSNLLRVPINPAEIDIELRIRSAVPMAMWD
jgi:hypothetical protein